MKTRILTLSSLVLLGYSQKLCSQSLLPYPFSADSIQQNDTVICKGSSLSLGISKTASSLKNGLVAFYPLDGNASELTKNYGGTVAGTINYIADRNGVTGRAMQGGSGYIQASSSVFQYNYNQSFSVSLWFATNGSTSGRLLSTEYPEGNFRIAYDNTQKKLGVQYGEYFFVPVTDKQWTHLVWTNTNGNEKIYLNGQLAATQTETAFELLHYGAPFTIGAKASWAWDKWNGKIDDVGVWGRELSASEVQQLYSSELTDSLTYSWSTGETTSAIQVQPSFTTTYYVTISDGFSSYRDSVTVTVLQPASYNPLPDTTRFCGGSASLSAGEGFSAYLWNTGATTQEISTRIGGFYQVTATNAEGCKVSDSTYLSLINVSLLPKDTTICKGTGIELSARSLSKGFTEDLVAYYPFNGNAKDESGNNNGTVYGATLTTDRFGKVNQAYSFNGMNQYIQTARAAIPTTGNYSINIWLYSPANSNYNTEAISQGGSCVQSTYIGYVTNGKMRLGGGGVNRCEWGWETTINYPFGSWHMFTIAKGSSKSYFYIDGQLRDSSTVYTNPINSGSTIIGRQQANGMEWWNGKIDDIGIWTRAFSSAEVLQLYSSTSVNPIAYSWSTGETTATIQVSPTTTTTYSVQVSDGITVCQDSVKVAVNDPSTYNPLPANQFSCKDSLLLEASSGFAKYLWNTGANSPFLTVAQSGRYSITVSDFEGCQASDTILVSIVKANIINTDTSVCPSAQLYLQVDTSKLIENGIKFLGEYNGHYYYASTETNFTWTQARDYAQRLSPYASLVIINDAAENNFLTYVTQGQYMWLGLWQDLSSPAYSEPGGGWKWIDGSLPGYLNWGPGEPNNGMGAEHFGCFNNASGQTIGGAWNDGMDIYHFSALIESSIPLAKYQSTIRWSTGDTLAQIAVQPEHTTTYYVTVSDGISSCRDSVTVIVHTPAPFNPLADTTRVCGTVTSLDAGQGFSAYLWNTGATISSITPSVSGYYQVRATNSDGCKVSDSTYLSLLDATILQKDTAVCVGSTLTLRLATPTTSTQLKNGLVAFYPLDGNAQDITNANSGSINGTVNFVADRNGVVNHAMQGGTGSITAASSVFQFGYNQDFSVSLWFTTNGSTSGRIVSTEYPEGNFRIAYYHDWGKLAVQFGEYFLVPVTDKQWTHLVWTNHSGEEKVYLNGQLVATQMESIFERLHYGAPFTIGGKAPGYDFWNGKIDDVGIWSRVLTATEVQQLYSSSLGEGLSYKWSTGDTTTSIQVSPTETTTYYVTVSDGISSCQDSVTVTVNVLPEIGVNSGTICKGSSLTLLASGATQYSWSPAFGLSNSSGNQVVANPDSTTTYTVTGFDETTGCSNTTEGIVVVNPLPTLLVNSATICAGSSVSLVASGASTYMWSPSESLSQTTGDNVIASPASSIIYTITGFDSNTGCSNSTTSTVTVNPLPDLTVNSESICIGSFATLIARGASSYLWSPSTELNQVTGDTVIASPTNTITYTVNGINSLTGCSNTALSTVTVNPLPAVSVNSGAICKGSSLTLSATGASLYSWSPGAGLSATTGSEVVASPEITTTYTITGTQDITGCVNSATSTVTVNSLPAAPAGSSASRCGSGTVSLSASVPSGQTVKWYASATGGSVLATGANFTTPTLSNTTTYYAEATITSTGCASASRTAVTATVINVSAPMATNNSRCGTGTVDLTAIPQEGASLAWFSTSKGTTVLSTSTTYTTPSLKTTTTYYVESRASSCVSATRTAVTATINTLPAAATAGSSSRCGAGEVTISATPPTGATVDWYSSTSGGTLLLSGSLSYTVKVNSTTTFYAVSRNLTTGCLASTRTAVTATVSTAPAAPTSISGTLTVCPKSGTNYKYTSTTVTGVAGYVWSIPVCATGSSTTNTITIRLTGGGSSDSIFVQSRNSTGCLSVKRGVKITTATSCTACLAPAATATLTSVAQQTLPEESRALQIKANPNPSASVFHLTLLSQYSASAIHLRVLDITGRVVEDFGWIKPGVTKEIGGTFRAGVYIVEATQGNERQLLKIVKNK